MSRYFHSLPGKVLKVCGWLLLAAQMLRFAGLIYESPANRWNDLQLAPTLYLCHGINVYGTVAMPGVSVLYGPAGILAYAPAALAASPEGAIRTAYGCVIAYGLLALLLPVVLMGRAAGAAGGRRFSWMLVLVPMAVISLLACLSAGLLTLHCDLPAICCLSLAAAAVAARSRGFHFWCAVLCVLAISCKITYAAGAGAVFCAVWWLDGWRSAIRFGGLFAIVFAAALALFAKTLGLGILFDSLVILPARQAWVLNLDLAGASVAQFKSANWGWLTTSVLWKPLCAAQSLVLIASALLLPAGLILLFSCNRNAPADGAGEAPSVFSALRRWRITLLCFAVAMLPVAVLGVTKIGGYLNSLSAFCLFVLLLVVVYALPWLDSHRDDFRMTWFGVAASLILSLRLVSLAGLDVLHAKSTLYPALSRALQANPDQLWLPTRPLAHWFYQGRITHSGDVLWCYHLAGRDWPSTWLHRYLPPKLAFIAGYRADEPEKGFGLHEDFAPAPALPGLDDDFPALVWPPGDFASQPPNTKLPSH